MQHAAQRDASPRATWQPVHPSADSSGSPRAARGSGRLGRRSRHRIHPLLLQDVEASDLPGAVDGLHRDHGVVTLPPRVGVAPMADGVLRRPVALDRAGSRNTHAHDGMGDGPHTDEERQARDRRRDTPCRKRTPWSGPDPDRECRRFSFYFSGYGNSVTEQVKTLRTSGMGRSVNVRENPVHPEDPVHPSYRRPTARTPHTRAFRVTNRKSRTAARPRNESIDASKSFARLCREAERT
jgi:hypothetical protein